MRIIKTYILIIPIITLSLILNFFLYFIALVIGFFIEDASALEPYVSDAILLIASWPSLLLKIFPTTRTMNGPVRLFNPLIITVNAIGWALIGFIVGLVICIAKRKTIKMK